jgi:hypothetical protein
MTSYLAVNHETVKCNYIRHLGMGVRRGVSKRVDDSHKLPAVRLFWGWPAVRRRVEHGRPGETLGSPLPPPCHTPMHLGNVISHDIRVLHRTTDGVQFLLRTFNAILISLLRKLKRFLSLLMLHNVLNWGPGSESPVFKSTFPAPVIYVSFGANKRHKTVSPYQGMDV